MDLEALRKKLIDDRTRYTKSMNEIKQKHFPSWEERLQEQFYRGVAQEAHDILEYVKRETT